MNLKIVLDNNNNNLDTFTTSEDDQRISWMPTKLMGKHLIMRNISILNKIWKIESIEIPKEFHSVKELIHQRYPSVKITSSSIKDDLERSTVHKFGFKSHSLCRGFLSNSNQFAPEVTEVKIQLNSILSLNESNKLIVDIIQYPWDFLKCVNKIMSKEITHPVISKNAMVSKTSIIKGPCIVEDGVVIDDFCKIIGPAYIGTNSFVGMGSLIRNSILEQNIKVGFNCEIGKSYFAGNDKISHQNVILDTIVGQNVWFGGYSGTANVLLDRRSIKYRINNKFIDTGTDHFGCVIEDNCCIGASVIILPGRRVRSNTYIQAGTIFKSQKESINPHQKEGSLR
jgi:acetyltransferase-like isoleucine patch superfamily enzyme